MIIVITTPDFKCSMLVFLSHALAFTVLSVAAVRDLLTTEVSDKISIIGVIGGLGLHLAASIPQMNFQTLLNTSILLADPIKWTMALGEPLIWSIGIGTALSIYGWGLYFLGLWGGADAFAMSILGFAAPYGLNGPGFIHVGTLFITILIVGFIYTIGYALYLSRGKKPLKRTLSLIKQQEKRISIEILGAAILSALTSFSSVKISIAYFGFFLFLIFIYRFVKVVQDDMMTREIKVEDLEPGEVLAADEEKGGKVKGITQEEIDQIDTEKVNVREGVRFIPVFPIALLLTEIMGESLLWILISL